MTVHEIFKQCWHPKLWNWGKKRSIKYIVGASNTYLENVEIIFCTVLSNYMGNYEQR